jgi:hypothetical protein
VGATKVKSRTREGANMGSHRSSVDSMATLTEPEYHVTVTCAMSAKLAESWDARLVGVT